MANEDIHNENNMQILFSGLKAELIEFREWFVNSFGKYSPNDLSERMTFDIMMSPPGYSRRQATFRLGGRVNQS